MLCRAAALAPRARVATSGRLGLASPGLAAAQVTRGTLFSAGFARLGLVSLVSAMCQTDRDTRQQTDDDAGPVTMS
ncbi:ORC1-type DNA replication protein 9 [Frankliniella fusca]|uniref:ORC1-type DNA replication protein 9 n=1 Tax=Frankliniella fusca TaxID=407009 RepID=A0AAE1GSL7_9NEOP|nr:ORC1-type DNA replication protein 9 [Frankliniella fusca]